VLPKGFNRLHQTLSKLNPKNPVKLLRGFELFFYLPNIRLSVVHAFFEQAEFERLLRNHLFEILSQA
jgi:hypothetical protein